MSISPISGKENRAHGAHAPKKASSSEDLIKGVASKSLIISGLSTDSSPQTSPKIREVLAMMNPRTCDGKFLNRKNIPSLPPIDSIHSTGESEKA